MQSAHIPNPMNHDIHAQVLDLAQQLIECQKRISALEEIVRGSVSSSSSGGGGTRKHARQSQLEQYLPKRFQDGVDVHPPMPTSVEDSVTVYTDGSCLSNGTKKARAGIGVWWGPGDPRNVSKPLDYPPHTNNRAEVAAVIAALEQLPEHIPIILCTDSEYVINSMSKWMLGWVRNGWKNSRGGDVKNQDLLKRLWDVLNSVGVDRVRFCHVPAHTGKKDGNYWADLLAKDGAKK